MPNLRSSSMPTMQQIIQNATSGNLKISKTRMAKLQSSAKANKEGPVGRFTFPRSVANLQFSKNNKLKSTRSFRRLKGTTKLPEEWNNYTGSELKYSLTTRPQNQRACGSCFAFAVANSISDAFVFQGLSFNPNLSPMSILSCMSKEATGDPQANLGCDGGNPEQVLQEIALKGIPSQHCMDYDSMCNADPYCIGTKNSTDPKLVNQVIPSCGCCVASKDTHYRYYIRNSQNPQDLESSILLAYNSSASFPNDPRIDRDAVQKIKEHLYKYGSCPTGYIIKGNFTGDASKVPGQFDLTAGVYVETENYSGNQADVDAINGGHAVCVVGWGIQKGVFIPSLNTKVDLPYWMARNTWGSDWGFGGYFKFAMYQSTPGAVINEYTAFERIHQDYIGGVLLFTPGKTELMNSPQSSSCSGMVKGDPLLEKLYSHENDPTVVGGESGGGSSVGSIGGIPIPEIISVKKWKKSSRRTRTIIGILILLVIYLLYKQSNK